MASGSPPTRIDQFFASKKKRIPLSGNTVNDVKTTLEGSPSAKGTLDNYFVISPDNEHKKRHSHTAHVVKESVKRNLALEINKKEDSILLAQGSSRITKSSKGVVHQKEGSLCLSMGSDFSTVEVEKSHPADQGSENCNVSNGVTENTLSVSLKGVERNPELKQFASDFLSLYCSELQSSVNLPLESKLCVSKRKGCSSLPVDEEESSTKRHCSMHLDQCQLEVVITPTKGNNSKEMQCDSILQTVKEIDTSYKELSEMSGHDALKPQASLRKCNMTPNSSINRIKHCTPLNYNVRGAVTPKSMHGSSIFSPGEAFWNEAIQVADGLFAPVECCLPYNGEDANAAGSLYEKKSSCNLQCQNLLGINNEVRDGDNSCVLVTKEDASLGGLKWKPVNPLAKDVSPLSVRHLDFLSAEKNYNEINTNCSIDYAKDAAGRSDNQFGHVAKNKKRLHDGNLFEREYFIANGEALDVQPIMGTHAASKKKMDIPGQDVGSYLSGTPEIEVRKHAAHGCEEAITPSSFLPASDCLDISGWLPPEICRVYRLRGISKLYNWQVDCLRVDGVLQKRNLVYCASTSAGKSLVAEILMLRRVISTGKIALLVLPYVSICAEKAEQLEALLEPIGKHVRGYYGNQGGGTLPKDTSVAVCTIEKANSLINRLLEESRLSEVGIIVIDELHMVGDQNRGYLLELILTKLRYATGEGNTGLCSGESSGSSSGKADPSRGLQIVGMSATMPNVAAVADWLQAALYQTDFRPVPLEEFIKVGNTIYNRKMEIVRTISKTANFCGKDPEHIVELCHEVVQEGHSVLMFCSSRKGCESAARHISKFLTKRNVNLHSDKSGSDNITSAIDALRKCPAGLDSILEETLPCGVAYHHAGLTVEEREIIEGCYRKGLVHVLTATSTLAAGVNLPARRVIFRQPRIGREFIDGTRYKQMAGRAGRTGIDTKGESVLICKLEEVKKIMRVLNESCPPLLSCLSEDKNGMTHAILEVVAAGIVQSASDIHRYVKCTLLNSIKPFNDVVKSAQDSLRWLCHRKFLLWNEDTKLYSSTPLGRAAFGSALSPEESLTVLDDLLRAREGFVLASDLHVVYLVTPINVDIEPDWELFYERFMGLSTLDQSVGNRVGVLEPFLMRMAHGAPIHNSKRTHDNKKQIFSKSNYFSGISNTGILSDQQTLRVCKRFYVALVLSRLVQEVPVIEVCDTFKVARGMVQSLQENAGRFASMVSVFCERLSWHDLEGLVSKFQNRVSFGVRAEIVELTTIPYVKGSRARALYNAGFRTPLAIAEAHVSEIVKVIFEYSSWVEQELSQRRTQLGVAKKIKNGARKIVLDKAEESRIAAFSAFKSLGLNIPQFSRPLLNSTSDNIPGQEATCNSSGEDSTSSLIGSLQADPFLGNENHDKNALDKDGIKSRTAEGVNMIPSLQSNFVTEIPQAGNVLVSIVDHTENMSLDPVLVDPGDEIKVLSANQGVQELPEKEKVCINGMDVSQDKGPLNAVNISGGFDSFLKLWESSPDFYFDIHFNKRLELNSAAPFEILGIAICWENSPVYYINLPKDLYWSEKKGIGLSGDELLEMSCCRWNKIGKILGRKDVRMFAWNLKIQIQVLRFPAVSIQRFGQPNTVMKNMDLELVDNLYYMLPPVNLRGVIDLCIVTWILWPDEERSSTPNLEKEIKKRLPSEVAAAAQRNGRWKNQMRRTAHNGCCRRVAQTRALCSFLWKLLVSEELLEVLMSTETPLVNVLADMEIWGIGVDMEKCINARHVLGKKLRYLEKEAYELAGITFSLYATADVANILYGHMKLPVPEGSNKGKQHPSTDKHCLDNLRNVHPIVSVIQEHRTLSKLMNCTLGSIFSLARLSLRTQRYTLHGRWLQMSTSTGRLSMEEPNLQSVENMVEFKSGSSNEKGGSPDSGHNKINPREFLVPTQEKWLLLTADYSQIELRLMAHFSRDSSLIDLLSSRDGDVFKMIAAKWRGNGECCSISSQDRDHAKRLVYGILYGMSAKTLAAQLGCTTDEANEKIQSFKTSFPGVASWLCDTIASCHRKGYVKTIRGRKRFLSKIKFGNSTEKSKAQRQAVNSICQGSAADIIKVAMINIYAVIVEGVEMSNIQTRFAEKFQMLRNRCKILLQVHDELVLEADPCVIKEAGLLLQMSMESAARLLVPLHVKLKVGSTWGSMDPFVIDE